MRLQHTIVVAAAVLILAAQSAVARKSVCHYVTVPLIEGVGVYASVATLVDKDASLHADIAPERTSV